MFSAQRPVRRQKRKWRKEDRAAPIIRSGRSAIGRLLLAWAAPLVCVRESEPFDDLHMILNLQQTDQEDRAMPWTAVYGMTASLYLRIQNLRYLNALRTSSWDANTAISRHERR